jgi:hypothetical protein
LVFSAIELPLNWPDNRGQHTMKSALANTQ